MADRTKIEMILELVTKNAEQAEAMAKRLEKLEQDQVKHTREATEAEKKLLAQKKLNEDLTELQRQHEEQILDLKRKALPLAKQEKELQAEIARLKEKQKRGGLNEQQQLALKQRQLVQERELVGLQTRQQGILSGTLGSLIKIGAAYQMINLAQRGFRELISTGFEFNQTMQDSRIGIAAVLTSLDEIGEFDNFNDALEKSERFLKNIKEEAASSPATIQELTEAFTAMTGVLSNANIEGEQQVRLVRLISQAVKTFGLRGPQILQELRGLISGENFNTVFIGRALNISPEQIRAARETGELYAFLEEKLQGFEVAAEESAQTWSVASSNMADAFAQLTGEITGGQFESAIGLVQRMTNAIDTLRGNLERARGFGGVGQENILKARAINLFGGSAVGTPGTLQVRDNAGLSGERLEQAARAILQLQQEGLDITREQVEFVMRRVDEETRSAERRKQDEAAILEEKREAARIEAIQTGRAELQQEFLEKKAELEFRALDARDQVLQIEAQIARLQAAQQDPTLPAKELLKLLEEELDLEIQILEIQQKQQKTAKQTAAERIALAREQGFVPSRSGTGFVRDNLDRFQQSQAGVFGESIYEFNEDFGGTLQPTSINEGGLDDPIAHFQSISEAAQAAVFDYAASVGTVSDQVHRSMGTIFGGIETGGKKAFDTLLGDTNFWVQKLGAAGYVVGAITESITQMAAEWITQRILMATVGKALAAADSAVVIGQAQVLNAAWTPAAISANIATLGGASAIGLAGYTAAQASGLGLAAIPAFAEGGFPAGRNAVIMVNDMGQEFVANAGNTARNSAALQAGNDGATLGVLGGSERESESKVLIYWGSESGLEELRSQIPGPTEIRKIAQEEIKRYRG